MAVSKAKQSLRFRAGEVGFVFYEDDPFPGVAAGRTYAFGTIGDAAAWLIQQFSAEPETASVTTQQRAAG